MNTAELKKIIRTIPGFPKGGINFRDITPLLQNSNARDFAINKIKEYFKKKKIDVVAAAESRGFIFGSIIAHDLKCSFVPLRKPGKLPYKTIRENFTTEYSSDGFEIHEDAIKKGDNVLIIDDLLATGGTALAAIKLVERLGGKVVGLAFLIELIDLKGREKLKGYDVFSLLQFREDEK